MEKRSTLGSLRVRLALEELEQQEFDFPRAFPYREEAMAWEDPERQAALWFFGDLQEVSDALWGQSKNPFDTIERRREQLATAFAFLRSWRAGDLATLAWDPWERGAYVERVHAERRKQYHWLRAVMRTYEALSREQATILRRLAKLITSPLPAPRPRPPAPPKPPYTGVAPEHLEARLLDLTKIRCMAIYMGDCRIEARWNTEVYPLSPEVLGRLRESLDFIMAPAKVADIGSGFVIMQWEKP